MVNPTCALTGLQISELFEPEPEPEPELDFLQFLASAQSEDVYWSGSRGDILTEMCDCGPDGIEALNIISRMQDDYQPMIFHKPMWDQCGESSSNNYFVRCVAVACNSGKRRMIRSGSSDYLSNKKVKNLN